MSKEAMKLALEALENINSADNDRDFLGPEECCDLDNAITALREALAEQPAQQEPVATITITQRGPIRIVDNNFDDCVRKWPDGEYKLYTSPPAQRTWVGLTNAERNQIWREAIGWGDPSHDDIGLMIAIEAKLMEKNA